MMQRRWPSFRGIRWIAVAMPVCLSFGLAQAESEFKSGAEFGVLGGFFSVQEELAGPAGDDVEPTLGLRVGFRFTPRIAWAVDALYAEVDTDTFRGDATSINARSALEIGISPRRPNPWFVAGGLGYYDISFDSAKDFYSAVASLGFGQRIPTGGASYLRWELRADRTLAEDGLEDRDRRTSTDLTEVRFLVGLVWGELGSPTDTDADGVYDRRDGCPGTPADYPVDRRGCPRDTDGDGVFDGIDACPGTQAGRAVDPTGCLLDSDGDGLPDDEDRCPGSPPGARVDASGCRFDTDGDGVPDDEDRCPDTRAGATVDAAGCRPDSDGDGVHDGIDLCPDTPPGILVAASGCPRDSDGDGVFDGIDECPDTPWGAQVDPRGCGSDSDDDGVSDERDACRDTPRGVPVDERGCVKSFPLFSAERDTVVLRGVEFATGSAELRGMATTALDHVAAALRDTPVTRVEIVGHTDSAGEPTANRALSLRRAETVRDYLVDAGIAPGRLEVRGAGSAEPIADNDTAEGRERNRRVELRALD